MSNTKFSPRAIWLFSLGSIAVGVGSSYALGGLGQKVTAAAYFAVIGLGAFLSTYATRAKLGSAIGAFVVAAAVAGVAYFFLASSIFHDATTQLSAGVGADADQADRAGTLIGRFLGVFVGVIMFLETLIAGIVGTIIGSKSRNQTGLAALGSALRAAR